METVGPKPSPHLKWKGIIPLEYRYTAGIAGQSFLTTLKEKGIIIASKCEKCGDRRVPPRLYCANCFHEIHEYEELKGSWQVYSFGLDVLREKPVIYGLIKFPGVQGGLIHRIIQVNPRKVRIGMKVRAVMRPKRSGSINDIEGFAPLQG